MNYEVIVSYNIVDMLGEKEVIKRLDSIRGKTFDTQEDLVDVVLADFTDVDLTAEGIWIMVSESKYTATVNIKNK